MIPVRMDRTSQEAKVPGENLNHKIRALSGSAERLLGLGRKPRRSAASGGRLEREAADLRETVGADPADRSEAAELAHVAELDGLCGRDSNGTPLQRRNCLTPIWRASVAHLARTAAIATWRVWPEYRQPEPESTERLRSCPSNGLGAADRGTEPRSPGRKGRDENAVVRAALTRRKEVKG